VLDQCLLARCDAVSAISFTHTRSHGVSITICIWIVDLDVDERRWSSHGVLHRRTVSVEKSTISVRIILYVYRGGPRLSITKCILAPRHTAEIPIWFKCKFMWQNVYTSPPSHFYIFFRTPFFFYPLSFIENSS